MVVKRGKHIHMIRGQTVLRPFRYKHKHQQIGDEHVKAVERTRMREIHPYVMMHTHTHTHAIVIRGFST
jgi:hypothetical protein